jgi:hypothetical protein
VDGEGIDLGAAGRHARRGCRRGPVVRAAVEVASDATAGAGPRDRGDEHRDREAEQDEQQFRSGRHLASSSVVEAPGIEG